MALPFTYQVTIQELTDATTYNPNPTDITDRVLDLGLGAIRYELDSYDHDIGIFKHGNMILGCLNQDGYFNETESLFSFRRDLAKIEVTFFDRDLTEISFFKGVINEPMTRFNKNNDTVNFVVINQENVLSQVQVQVADISNADSFSDSIKAILNKTAITTVLNYDAADISVDYDGVIDDATKLHGLDTYTVLKKLLQASNSLFYVNSSDDMIVSTRGNTGVETMFYGAEDEFNRDNIIEVNGYSTGYNRIFNSVIVNDRGTLDATSVGNYGYREKRYTFDFVTDNGREDLIAANILAEFKDPKKEVSITVPVEESTSLNFLDDITMELNSTVYNNINISSTDTFKLMARNYVPDDFNAILKLREI